MAAVFMPLSSAQTRSASFRGLNPLRNKKPIDLREFVGCQAIEAIKQLDLLGPSPLSHALLFFAEKPPGRALLKRLRIRPSTWPSVLKHEPGLKGSCR